MNERIIELALEAGLLNYVDNETPPRYFIHGHADLEEVQRFADLVTADFVQKLLDKVISEQSNKYSDIVSDGGMDPRK